MACLGAISWVGVCYQKLIDICWNVICVEVGSEGEVEMWAAFNEWVIYVRWVIKWLVLPTHPARPWGIREKSDNREPKSAPTLWRDFGSSVVRRSHRFGLAICWKENWLLRGADLS